MKFRLEGHVTNEIDKRKYRDMVVAKHTYEYSISPECDGHIVGFFERGGQVKDVALGASVVGFCDNKEYLFARGAHSAVSIAFDVGQFS